jgi:hypothetical protein
VESDLIDADGKITPFYDDNGTEIASADAVAELIALMAGGAISKRDQSRRQSTPIPPIQRNKAYADNIDINEEEKELEDIAQQLLPKSNENQSQRYIYNNNKQIYSLNDLHNHGKITKTNDKAQLKKFTKTKN